MQNLKEFLRQQIGEIDATRNEWINYEVKAFTTTAKLFRFTSSLTCLLSFFPFFSGSTTWSLLLPGQSTIPLRPAWRREKSRRKYRFFHPGTVAIRVSGFLGLCEEIFPGRSGYPLKKIEKNEGFNRKKITITNNESFYS